MPILRTRHRLISSVPPPSPIDTAKGTRSAAVDDKVLSEYLERRLQIPDLRSIFKGHSWIPSRVDLRSLISKRQGFSSLGIRISGGVWQFSEYRSWNFD
uniref:Uncharacterized protein n=1 Tax=Nelumbo nucifera TaxID=4432 RepID=A0A822Z248_NELNU|nr:TPA_asm: hypothetical protein HUJ06_013425 [Nelumbo nucifera]